MDCSHCRSRAMDVDPMTEAIVVENRKGVCPTYSQAAEIEIWRNKTTQQCQPAHRRRIGTPNSLRWSSVGARVLLSRCCGDGQQPLMPSARRLT